METAITLLQNANLPSKFWTYACQTAIYLINRVPSSIIQNKSPLESLYYKIPDIQHLRVFGRDCYPLLKPYNTTKLQPKTLKCVFLRYASNYKGYICYELNKKKVFISKHVIFDELDFPYASVCTKFQPKSSVPTPSPSMIPNLQNILVSPVTINSLTPQVSSSTSTPQTLPDSPISNTSQSIIAPDCSVTMQSDFCPESSMWFLVYHL